MRNIIIENSDRFKSVLVTVNLLLPLEGNNNGKNALLAMVLKKSNELYKTEKELKRALASLYDTQIDVNVEKMGNLYNIQIGMELLNAKYMTTDELQKAKDIFCAILCKPNIVNDKFEQELFEREKASHIQKISEERDDKKKYALEGLNKEMFKDTDYGVSTIGTIDMVERITNEELISHYYDVIKRAEVVVTAIGNLSGMEGFPQDIYNTICEKCGKNTVSNKEDVEIITGNLEEKIENQDINQSVLCIGLKVEDAKKEDIYALMLYNAILGGTPASKLFQNVREKESLAYFAKSAYNRHKQVICMFSGVDPINNEKAKQVMLEQLEIIKRGEISEEEFYAAKQSLVSAYTELKDSKIAITRNILNNELYFNHEVPLEVTISKLQSLTLHDVIEISHKIKATNVFLLGGVPSV